MRLLLDAHVFLFFISKDRRLPARFRDAILDPDDKVFLSVVSIWEATVKHRLGKLDLPEPPEQYLPRNRERHNIATLPLTEAAACVLPTLPNLHRDPFDRMLVCQAIAHDLVVLSVDDVLLRYPIRTLPAG